MFFFPHKLTLPLDFKKNSLFFPFLFFFLPFPLFFFCCSFHPLHLSFFHCCYSSIFFINFLAPCHITIFLILFSFVVAVFFFLIIFFPSLIFFSFLLLLQLLLWPSCSFLLQSSFFKGFVNRFFIYGHTTKQTFSRAFFGPCSFFCFMLFFKGFPFVSLPIFQ